MSLLTVLTYPNKILKKVSEPVKRVDESIRKLAKDMFETMYSKNGIGLTAVQVGKLIRLIVIDVPIVDSIDPEKTTPDPVTLINPEIIEKEGETKYEEGCLSCPELIVNVDRAAKIKVKYTDLEDKSCELTAADLKAICIQHEIDHANGILLVDKISRVEQNVYRTKRARVSKKEKDRATIL